ncbi:MAG TPA: response regulator transcription factor [Solirubrobacteraceae bacterium]
MSERDPPIRVVVVDGHDLFRSGLVAILGSEPDIQVVGHASRATLGVQLTLELRGQVVLLDMDMPDIEGVSAIHTILAEVPQTRIIALSATSGGKEVEDEVAAAVLAGACGFLLKGTPIGDVVAAIRAAAIGGSWLSPLAAAAVLARLRRDHVERVLAPTPNAMLSARELEVIRLLAHGLDNSQIALELGISDRTAKNHLSNILAKLGVTNRVQAATYAVRHGLDR